MSTQAVKHHRKAAEHFAYAAKHHTEAGTYYGAGRHAQAAREAYLAHGHYLTASNHAAEAARLHTAFRAEMTWAQASRIFVRRGIQVSPLFRIGGEVTPRTGRHR
jgi:hypothetical protein